MSWPEPTRKDHEAFCQAEQWQRVRDARGRTGTHHVTYEIGLPDGAILRTRISHPVDRSGYGPSLWSHILRDQLQVTESEFWTCIRDCVTPSRGAPDIPATALPAQLAHLLIARVGLPESEVAAMTKDQAVSRLQRYWMAGS